MIFYYFFSQSHGPPRSVYTLDQSMHIYCIVLCQHQGSLEGFLTSARGIRQDLSLSFYLYVILNNLLTNMLNNTAAAHQFAYHPQCREVHLAHLSFADDILVFTNGLVKSLRGVLDVMNQFASISGLHINASKSTIFAA